MIRKLVCKWRDAARSLRFTRAVVGANRGYTQVSGVGAFEERRPALEVRGRKFAQWCRK